MGGQVPYFVSGVSKNLPKQTVFFSGVTNLSKICECYFEDRWQKDEMAGIQGRRKDGIKTVIKVEKCTFCDGRWNIESV